MTSASVRVQGALVSEEEFTGAVFSAKDVLGHVTEFTIIMDDRKLPSSLAFLVEIDGDLCETLSPSLVTRHSSFSFDEQPHPLIKHPLVSKQPFGIRTTASCACSTADDSRRRPSTS